MYILVDCAIKSRMILPPRNILKRFGESGISWGNSLHELILIDSNPLADYSQPCSISQTAFKESRADLYSPKLALIIKDSTAENLLLFTADPQLQLLLKALNALLEHSREQSGSYTRTEASIKKMLANMSHDLKTPLTVVLGLTETISHDHTITEEERKRLLHKVHDKAQEILSLMNKFFDLARLESGDKVLPLSLINLNEICINNILFFHESIVSQGIRGGC